MLVRMQLRALAVLGVTALTGVAAAGEASFVDLAGLQQAGLSEFWQARLPLAPKDTVEQGYLVDEVLYVTTTRGTVFSLTADVGLVRWGARLTKENYRIYKPSHSRSAAGPGPVLLTTPMEVFIVDRFTGRVITTFEPEFSPSSPAVGYDRLLFLGGTNGNFYAFVSPVDRSADARRLWEVRLRAPVTSAPVLSDLDTLVFASRNGTVCSCRAIDKALNWTFTAEGSILGDPVVTDDGVYVASLDRSLYKIDPASGEWLWRVRFPVPLRDGPIVGDQVVYQHAPTKGLVALDAETGEEIWQNPEALVVVSRTAAHDLLFTEDRTLSLVDRRTGAAIGRVGAQGVVHAVANARSDAAYLIAADGRVLCIRPAGAPYIRPEDMASARQRLNIPPRESERPRSTTHEDAGKATAAEDDPLRSRHDGRP